MARGRVRGIGAVVGLMFAVVLAGAPTEATAIGMASSEAADSGAARQAEARPSQAGAEGGSGLTPNQLTTSRALTRDEALAACGPAAAVAFARATGRTVTLETALVVARAVGWTAERGMAGPASQVALLRRLGIPAALEAGIDRARIARDVRAGRPVIVRTGGGAAHYLVAERLDPTTGRFDFGQSALVLRASAGRRWFSLDEIPSLGTGAPTHAIYLADQLVAATVSAPVAARGGLPAIPGGVRSSAATSLPTASEPRSRVVDTGGWGARLRAAPDTESKIVGLVSDGTKLTDLGTTATAAGRVWRRVADAEGTTAWIDGELLR